jgi:hypothetical protein
LFCDTFLSHQPIIKQDGGSILWSCNCLFIIFNVVVESLDIIDVAVESPDIIDVVVESLDIIDVAVESLCIIDAVVESVDIIDNCLQVQRQHR